MDGNSNNNQICSTCGDEIRGEVCEKCYTKEDQGFKSYTPSQFITRYLAMFFASGLLSVAYIGTCTECGQYSRFIEVGAKLFLFIAVYSFYMAVIFVLVTFGILTMEQAAKLDPLVRIRQSFISRK